MTNRRILADNMVRLYQEATLALHAGAGIQSSMYVRRRDHARFTLVHSCGFTNEMMARLHARTLSAGAPDRTYR